MRFSLPRFGPILNHLRATIGPITEHGGSELKGSPQRVTRGRRVVESFKKIFRS